MSQLARRRRSFTRRAALSVFSACVVSMKIQTQHLPQELLTEILLRLPVKSLVRFKGVCKFWWSLISDPHFASSHFELAAPRLLFSTYHGIRTMDLEGWLHPNPNSEAIYYDILPTNSDSRIVGSCRGFLLILDYSSQRRSRLYLWNPSTRLHKPIPIPIPSSLDYTGYLVLGFGYDSSKDDYLVVQVLTDTRPDRYSAQVQFFSLRANVWKCIDQCTNFTLASDLSPGLLFNGAIHWLARVSDFKSETNLIIIAFDLMVRRLFKMPLPGGVPDNSLCNLWVHGRFLSLAVMRHGTIDILVMEKYKVQSSWTKTLVLSLSDIQYEELWPVCSTKSGDIVVDDGVGLVKYSDKGEPLEHCKFGGYGEPRVSMYTESILSLPGC